MGAADLPWRSSTWPEKVGLDFAWCDAHGGWQGAQRKELKDFLASVQDGRLRKELGQMRAMVSSPTLILEGRVRFTNDGMLQGRFWGREYTRRHWQGMMISLAHEEMVAVHTSDDVAGTVAMVGQLYEWWQKDDHGSFHAGVQVQGDWGTATNRDYQIALMATLPGVGLKRARAVIKHFGGLPWRWDCTAKELMEVEGIGKGTAAKMMQVLNSDQRGEER